VFEKFADYWNKENVFIDRIVYLPLVDATVRLANLKSGGLDLIERLLATDIAAVKSDPKLKLSTAIELGYQGLTLNVGKDKAKGPLSQSAKVRQALDLSLDREAINQVVFNGESKPGNQWISPDHPYYQKAFPMRPRDVARAKAILAGTDVLVGTVIGFPHGNGTTATKVHEAGQALADGAVELDMVINISKAKSGDWDYVRTDIARVLEVDHRIYPQALRLVAEGRVTLAAAIAATRMFISPDTGPMHLASATEVPTVALFCNSNAARYHPMKSSDICIDVTTCEPGSAAQVCQRRWREEGVPHAGRAQRHRSL